MTHVEGIEGYKAFCRKTVQTGLYLYYIHNLLSFSVEDEIRVHRSCGFVPNVGSTADRGCFTRTGTHQVKFCGNIKFSENLS